VEIKAFERSRAGGYQLLYLMGHTSEREIFFDATRTSLNVILIEKKLISAIKVDLSRVQMHSLRKLLEGRTTDILQEDSLKQALPAVNAAKIISEDELNKWMAEKDDQAQAKEIRK
jgi:hypothetical protein